MSYGPYRYQNGKKYVFAADGRWWLVTKSYNGDDYGYLVSGQTSSHHRLGRGPSGALLRQRYGSVPKQGLGSMQPGFVGDRNRPSAHDPWNGNEFARELFQGQGAPYFSGANRLVNDVTTIYAAAYTAAFFAPELLASGQFIVSASRVGILGDSVGRIFWSGGFLIAGLRAAEVADEEGGTTLEMTPLGQWIESVAPNSTWLWKLASAGFALGAEGIVVCVQGDEVGWQSVWATIEYGILIGKNEIRIYSATGRW